MSLLLAIGKKSSAPSITWDSATGTNITLSNQDLTLEPTVNDDGSDITSDLITSDDFTATFTQIDVGTFADTTISLLETVGSDEVHFTFGGLGVTIGSPASTSDANTIPAIVNGDVIEFRVKASGVYITINSAVNSWFWDGINGSVPTLTGDASTDTNPSTPDVISGNKVFFYECFKLEAEFLSLTANFEA